MDVVVAGVELNEVVVVASDGVVTGTELDEVVAGD